MPSCVAFDCYVSAFSFVIFDWLRLFALSCVVFDCYVSARCRAFLGVAEAIVG